MSLAFGVDRLPTWTVTELPDGAITIRARGIERERGRQRATLSIWQADVMLAYSDLHVAKRGERSPLAKEAWNKLSQEAKALCPLDTLTHELDLFCLWLDFHHDEDRIEVEEFDPYQEPPALEFPLYPYIVRGGGTVLFGPPGAGKSWMLLLLAFCIANGIDLFWRVTQRPVLFVNLERSRESVWVREAALRKALAISGRSGIHFIHARGKGLASVAPKIAAFTRDYPDGIVLLDSLSRGNLGKLIDDDTANRFTDTMNGCANTWAAIGHTPRADSGHLFGSQHFDAGFDIGIKLSSEERIDGNKSAIGVSLTVTKRNDVPPQPVEYLALEFENGSLARIRKARAGEFSELAGEVKLTREQKLIDFTIDQGGKTTATEAANATGIGRSHVVDILKDSGHWVVLPREGKEQPYGLKSNVSLGTRG